MLSALFVAAYALVMSLLGMGCPFRALGVPSCPTCGLTRAYLCLFSGDIAGAFGNHQLFWLVPVAWLLACVDQNGTSCKVLDQRCVGGNWGCIFHSMDFIHWLRVIVLALFHKSP